MVADAGTRPAAPPETQRYVKQLKAFRDRLLDLSSRNPSVLVRKPTKKSCFDVRASAPAAAAEIIQKVTASGGEALLVADSDASPGAAAARAALVQLGRNAAARTEETGLQDLFLGMCWLEGFVGPGVFVRAPLVMVPVQLVVKRKQRRSGHYLVVGEGARPNRALLSALRKHRGFAAEETLGDALVAALPGKDEGEDALFARLVALWQEAALPAELAPFEPARVLVPLTKESIAALPQGPLRLTSALAVGMFPQTSTALFSDLDQMVTRALEGETDQGIVDNLLEVPGDDATANPANFSQVSLDDVADARLNLVVPSDPSQDAVVVRAQEADCVVVRGPPGTGKSQVIVNLIADALSRNRRVCVVCQKRAALDVVFARLRDVGLGGHAYLVHDEANDRPELYKQMRQALATGPAGDQDRLANVDALSQAIDDDIRSIRAIVEPLRTSFHGVRLSALYRRARTGFQSRLQLRDGPVDDAALQALCLTLRTHQAAFTRYDHPGSPVSLRRSWLDVGGDERSAALKALDLLGSLDVPTTALVRMDDGGARQTLLAHLDTVASLASRWFRWLLPRWWKSRGALSAVREAFGVVPEASWRETLERTNHVYAAIDAVAALMTPAWRDEALARVPRPAELAAWARALKPFVVHEFSQVQQHDVVRRSVDVTVVDACLRDLASDEDWADHVEQTLAIRWIEEAERQHPALRGNPLQQYEELKSRLRDRLELKRKGVALRIANTLRSQAHSSPSPDERRAGKAELRSYQSAKTKLEHEVSKKRQLKPLRALMNLYGPVMRKLTPCWLASPEVIAEVFPLEKGLFDLVIFDEASQLSVERALPVLCRARHVVIAGDEQQMPPSNFFGSSADDEEEDEEDPLESLQQESLLVLAKRIYGFSYLGWHYRSARKELIDFSNHAFYEGTLNVAANVARAEEVAPIRWVPVNGTWHGNQNLAEAVQAVDLLDKHLSVEGDGKAGSIGIITFNQKQTDAIKDEIEKRRGENPDFAARLVVAETLPSVDDRPFVKNIENVQGDERDLIIFSVGYGRTPEGVFRRAFGPLGQSGGENRLNVAVTRAKRQVIVLCSFELDLLAADTGKNLGPKRFRQYLQYAKAISDGDQATLKKVLLELNPGMDVHSVTHGLTFESPFEEAVYDALHARGYELETQVGLSGYRIDLAVVDPRDPTRFCLGIECDGASFHSGKSVRERDVARQRFLESRGWRIARVWSRNWWIDPQREVRRLVELLPPVAATVPGHDDDGPAV